MSDHLPPLPPALREGAKRLARAEPPEDFDLRLERALADADRRPPERSRPLWSGLVLVLPAISVAALLLHLGAERDAVDMGEVLLRRQEHHVVLGEDGHAWVELSLWTHHHDEAATVEVETPPGMRLTTAHAGAGDPSAACDDRRCTHRFVTRPRPGRASLRLHVTEPGSHSITVEHVSRERRVRESFVVHAR